MLKNIDANHVSLLSNLIATAVFTIPLIFLALNNMIWPMAIYAFVMFYSLIISLSNVKYSSEISRADWDKFFQWPDYAKKFIKKIDNKANHG
jgi:hypothetical protein